MLGSCDFFTGLYYVAQATKLIGLLPQLPVYMGNNVCQVCPWNIASPFLQQDLIAPHPTPRLPPSYDRVPKRP